jgi:hypothetical protein
MKEYWPEGHPPPKIIAKIESTGTPTKDTFVLKKLCIERWPFWGVPWRKAPAEQALRAAEGSIC